MSRLQDVVVNEMKVKKQIDSVEEIQKRDVTVNL